MSKVWYIMLLGAVSALLFTDPGKAVTAMIAGSHASVKLAVELAALYGFWLGFFGIIEKIGLADFLSKLLRPLVRFLYPGLNDKGRKYVTMNMAANLLGLGNAATPMAMRAIHEMDTGEKRASQNMIMLTVISATSLQLLPTTVIGLRATHGSVNPADFLLPATVATVVSTVLGVVLVKSIGFLLRKTRRKKAENENGAGRPLGYARGDNKATSRPLGYARGDNEKVRVGGDNKELGVGGNNKASGAFSVISTKRSARRNLNKKSRGAAPLPLARGKGADA